MKGFVKIDKCDLLSAIIGFEMWYDECKELRRKGIALFYEKHYTNGGRITRYWNRKLTPNEFVRKHVPMFHNWADVLGDVLTPEETDELDKWCWTDKSEVEPIKVLYKSLNCVHNDALVDNAMAAFIVKHKNYLENV